MSDTAIAAYYAAATGASPGTHIPDFRGVDPITSHVYHTLDTYRFDGSEIYSGENLAPEGFSIFGNDGGFLRVGSNRESVLIFTRDGTELPHSSDLDTLTLSQVVGIPEFSAGRFPRTEVKSSTPHNYIVSSLEGQSGLHDATHALLYAIGHEVGETTQELLTIDPAASSNVTEHVSITGLDSGEAVTAIAQNNTQLLRPNPVREENFAVYGAGDWTAGATSGDGATSTESGTEHGLCMSVSPTYENLASWNSKNDYIPLVDNTVYRVRVTAWTDTPSIEMPSWGIYYGNHDSISGDNPFLSGAYAGGAIFNAREGEANVIDGEYGRTEFETYITPMAVKTAQWKGLAADGGGAFSPEADAINDITLHLEATGSQASGASRGAICIKTLRVDAFLVDNLKPVGLFGGDWGPAINTSKHQLFGNDPEDDVGSIDNASATANINLTEGLMAASLMPNDSTVESEPEKFFPVDWESDTLYKGTLLIRSNVDGGRGTTEGEAPPYLLAMEITDPNYEVQQIHFTTCVTSESALFRASSPRLVANTNGDPQEYIGYFYSHYRTANTSSGAGRLRIGGIFLNFGGLTESPGTDPFTVVGMRLEKMILPEFEDPKPPVSSPSASGGLPAAGVISH